MTATHTSARRSHHPDSTDNERSPSRPPAAGTPWLPRKYLPRTRLWARLDIATQEAITVVVAPAGSGKTLGVAGWLQQTPDAEGAIWLDASSPITTASFEQTIDAAAAPSAKPRIVVIDDAHLLSTRCIRYIEERLEHDPESLRLVLLTRWDLPIRGLLAEMLGNLTIVRGNVLTLDDTETAFLITSHAGEQPQTVHDIIAERAQGWCAAVVLAARACAAASSPDNFVRYYRASNAGTADLFVSEVFASLQSRERHLILCTATEPTVTAATARELTNDPNVGDVLVRLETTGLLVHRISEGPLPGAPEDDDEHVRYRLHPLIAEIARRRLASGGVEVELARATVRRAADAYVGRGHIGAALRLMYVTREFERVAGIIAENGPRVITPDTTTTLHAVVNNCADVLEQHPDTWATLARAAHQGGEISTAGYWAEKLFAYHATEHSNASAVDIACTRLQYARSGTGPSAALVADAVQLLSNTGDQIHHSPFVPLLSLEVGIAENWLGDLESAQLHLSDALVESRAIGMSAMVAEALSHLSVNAFMRGHDDTARDLAGEVLAAEAIARGPASSTTQRAEIISSLVQLQRPNRPGSPEIGKISQHILDDPTGRFWQQILAARLQMYQGSTTTAQDMLRGGPDQTHLPRHLELTLIAERSRMSVLTLDHEQLRDAAAQFDRLAAPGESDWTRAMLADLKGDLAAAAELYEIAADVADVRQPDVRAMSRVCAAQVHQQLGHAARARTIIQEAIALSAHTRNRSSFLGWSTHGAPVSWLLREHADVVVPWANELVEAFRDYPGVVASLRPRTATVQESNTTAEPAVRPSLSAREREVLAELARGATYADIAANLIVSENTVKTHISSMYHKLSVGRRSDALAVARKLQLI
ncbi:LuxR C-terminal-related transcriptional regulator [Cumulibacter soli]|uniref:LuxR C-terminal-related transcriptional regulator n=1 Tax=Cumulibacter soli TaxID=2546344 RepID=UPI00141986D7|nr:LuxR C-terminal-related transcriptional regulator [Cumulibacter soli]